MTIGTSTSKVVCLGNGATTSFSYNFLIPQAAYAVVTYTDASGNQTVLSPGAYTISGLGNAAGGTVTYNPGGTPIASGTTLTIQRLVPYQQTTSLVNQSGYYPDVVEGALDNLEMQVQQLALYSGLTIQAPITDVSPNLVLPPAAQRAGKSLAFDASGNVLMGPQLGDLTAALNQADADAATATTQAGIATTQAGIASGAASNALNYSALALYYQSGAQAAQAAALANAKAFTTTAAGIAATTNGQQFLVTTTDLYTYNEYWNNAGTATLLGTVNLANGTYYSVDASSSQAHQVWLDSGGKAIGHTSDTGIYDDTSGTPVQLTGYPAELSKQAGATGALSGMEDSRGCPLQAVDASGRLHLNDFDDVFALVASADVGTVGRYEQFGITTYSNFLKDKAENFMKPRLRIEKTIYRWDEDSGCNFGRMPSLLWLSSTTAIAFFSQRGSSFGNNNGESAQRAVCRTLTFNWSAQTVSVGATVVINQPAQWNVQNPNGGWMVNPVAFIEGAGGPHPGRIHCYINTLTSTNERPDDTVRVYKIIEQHSDDNGATWSAAVDFYTQNNIFNGTSGLTTGIPGNPPGTPSLGCGPLTGTGNSLIRLTQGAHAGRLVMVLNGVPGNGTIDWWQGCIYSDDEGQTWTQGQFYHQATQEQSEVQIVELTDGRILMQTRVEQNNGVTQVVERGQYRSVNVGDPSSFTYEGYNTTCVVSDCSCAMLNSSYSPANGYGKVMVGGPGDSVYGSRDKHRIALSYDKGVTFSAYCELFPEIAGIGYSWLSAVPNQPGVYALIYETFNGINAINTEDSLRLLVFNDAELFRTTFLI